MKKKLPVEVIRILPAYKTLPKMRKLNVLSLLITWALNEIVTIKK